MKPLLTCAEVADLLRTTPAAIRQRRYSGAPCPPALATRPLRFRASDVQAWIDAQPASSLTPRAPLPAAPGRVGA